MLVVETVLKVVSISGGLGRRQHNKSHKAYILLKQRNCYRWGSISFCYISYWIEITFIVIKLSFIFKWFVLHANSYRILRNVIFKAEGHLIQRTTRHTCYSIFTKMAKFNILKCTKNNYQISSKLKMQIINIDVIDVQRLIDIGSMLFTDYKK